MCDCLQQEKDRRYLLGDKCDSFQDTDFVDWILGDSSTKGEDPDCYDVGGKNPIVQNVISRARYCGKRGGVAFKDAERPSYQSTDSLYYCPKGYLPCFAETNIGVDLNTA